MRIQDRPYLLLTLAVLFWAGNFIVGRAFHADIPPVALAFWRWVGAALLITVPAMRHLRPDLPALLANWKILLLLSLAGIATFNTLVYSGLQYTQAVNAFLLQSLMPVLIVLLSFFLFRERVMVRQVLGILISLLGAVTIIARGDWHVVSQLSFNQGDLLVFLAVVSYAIYSVMLRKRPRVHAFSLIAVTFWCGALMILPFYLWEALTIRSLQPDLRSLAAIGYVALFPSILSYLCYNRGVELIGANRAGLFIHLMPVFGSIMAILFLGEAFLWFHAVGMLMIAAGILLATYRIRPLPEKVG
ncbi:MAG TPA: DMT family transporter [Desulfuromonadales bacterium]|nr:DMT family transporter [Desulfuromonadales bacterium]